MNRRQVFAALCGVAVPASSQAAPAESEPLFRQEYLSNIVRDGHSPWVASVHAVDDEIVVIAQCRKDISAHDLKRLEWATRRCVMERVGG